MHGVDSKALGVAVWAVAMGCRPAGVPAEAGLQVLEVGAVDTIGGVRRLVAEGDGPSRLVVWHDDGEQVRSTVVEGQAEVHDVLFVGFAPGEHTVWGQLVHSDGRVSTTPRVAFEQLGLPGLQVEVLAHEPERSGDGWLLGPLTVVGAEEPTYLVMLDEALRPVWWTRPEPSPAEVQLDGHHVVGSGGGGLVRTDLLGGIVSRVQPELGSSHHDVVPQPDGSYWTLVERRATVDAYPVDYDRLEPFAPAELRDSYVAHVAADGSTLASVALADLLDTQKIGWNSLDFLPKEQWFDWNHANGLALDPRDGSPVVTLRHLDAVVKLTPDLQLDWILGPHEGWRAPWSEALLQAGDDVVWPLHPHAPEVLADGTVLVFDNHNEGHTPYTEPPSERPTSRAVAFRIVDSADGRRAEQLWEVDTTATGPLYCGAVGDVDVDDAGRVLVDYGFVHFEREVALEELGLGHRAVRWVEALPGDDEPVLDVRLASDPAVWPDGVFSYRVQRVPSRYGVVPWSSLGAIELSQADEARR
jgi:hypothetical protein